MNRRPIYHESQQVRLISAPNGLWQVQTCLYEHGTGGKSIWRNEHFPMPLSDAFQVMSYFTK